MAEWIPNQSFQKTESNTTVDSSTRGVTKKKCSSNLFLPLLQSSSFLHDPETFFLDTVILRTKSKTLPSPCPHCFVFEQHPSFPAHRLSKAKTPTCRLVQLYFTRRKTQCTVYADKAIIYLLFGQQATWPLNLQNKIQPRCDITFMFFWTYLCTSFRIPHSLKIKKETCLSKGFM